MTGREHRSVVVNKVSGSHADNACTIELPNQCEDYYQDDCQYLGTQILCFLIDFDQAIEEG